MKNFISILIDKFFPGVILTMLLTITTLALQLAVQFGSDIPNKILYMLYISTDIVAGSTVLMALVHMNKNLEEKK